MKMERTAEVIRGWPYDGSLNRAEPITAAATLVNGDWVVKGADGTVNVGSVTFANGKAGLVVVGNGDSGSALNSGKAEVLWGNFIAKVSNFTAGAYVPGAPVTVTAGKIALATLSTGTTNGSIVVGHVLDVVAVSATNTAHVVIAVY
jgi:hypothetical protein